VEATTMITEVEEETLIEDVGHMAITIGTRMITIRSQEVEVEEEEIKT